jgi:hypothetical protein
MAINKNLPIFIRALAIAMFQVVATQVVTFIASLFLSGMGEDFGQTQPILFGLLIGLTFSLGVFLVGWLAIAMHWLVSPARLGWRILGTLLGAYLPLLVAYFIYHEFIPGNPFFTLSILLCVLGFHLPGWIKK